MGASGRLQTREGREIWRPLRRGEEEDSRMQVWGREVQAGADLQQAEAQRGAPDLDPRNADFFGSQIFRMSHGFISDLDFKEGILVLFQLGLIDLTLL